MGPGKGREECKAADGCSRLGGRLGERERGEDLMKGTAEEEGVGEPDSLAPQLFGKTHRPLWKTQDVGMQAGKEQA